MDENMTPVTGETIETVETTQVMEEIPETLENDTSGTEVPEETTEESAEQTSDADSTEESLAEEETTETPVQIESAFTSEMLKQLIDANANLELIIEYEEKESMSLWDKPLKDYNALEGIGLVTLVIIVAVVIFKIVGGIISCSL